MAGNSLSAQPPSGVALDSREYVDRWARGLVAVIGKREARGILRDYAAIAAIPRLTKIDREIAAQRAEVLAELL